MRKTTGISLLLLIFLSLCLITFSLLSLSGSAADEKLSQKAADHTEDYYHAVSTANNILSEIDRQLTQTLLVSEDHSESELPQSSANNSTLERAWSQICADIHRDSAFADALSTEFTDSVFTFEEKQGIPSLTFAISVTEDASQHLLVTLEFPCPESESDTLYHITSWQVINTAKWTPDQSQNLMRMSEASN